MGERHLGGFELLVVAALVHLGEHAYGAGIRREIARRSGRDVAIGAVYTTLSRLESKRLVESSLGEPTAKRGGRAKRYYEPTAEGRRALEVTLRALDGMTAGLDVGAEG